MVLGSTGWDRKVCGRCDTKTGIYNMEICTKRRGSKKIEDDLRTGLWLWYHFIIQQDNIIHTP